MAEPGCGIPEERWVDWLEGRRPAGEYEAMKRHLASCEACRAVRDQWQELLEPAEAIDPSPNERASGERNRNKLRRQVWLIGARGRIARAVTARGAWTSAVCFAFLLVSLLWMNRHPSREGSALEIAQAYAEKYEPNGAALIAKPDTVVYSLGDVTDVARQSNLGTIGRPTATVWMNGSTEELFLLMEGLLPSEGLDVQAWGTIENRQTNLGLLEFHFSRGHLYSHIEHLPNFEEVVFTIEPKGGSDHPTADASAVVRLAAEARR